MKTRMFSLLMVGLLALACAPCSVFKSVYTTTANDYVAYEKLTCQMGRDDFASSVEGKYGIVVTEKKEASIALVTDAQGNRVLLNRADVSDAKVEKKHILQVSTTFAGEAAAHEGFAAHAKKLSRLLGKPSVDEAKRKLWQTKKGEDVLLVDAAAVNSSIQFSVISK